jgi:hypothetical protein
MDVEVTEERLAEGVGRGARRDQGGVVAALRVTR